MLGRGNASVSVRSAGQALRDCQQDYDYLNSFERIYLCFDNDESGQTALKEVAKLFDVNKVYAVNLGKFKDANEMLVAGQAEQFREVWRNSKRYLPKGIINDLDTIREILSREDSQAVCTFPFPTVSNMAYGIRLGEFILITAQEKVGKTEVLRAIEYHILKNTTYKIGIIHLEESEKRSVQGLVGYELGVPAHLPDSGLSVNDQIDAYTKIAGEDGSRVSFYTHFGSDDPDMILGHIRYLVGVMGCKFIFLDHISMLVSTMAGTDDERKALDRLSTRLAMLTRELNFTLFLISHVNDEGQTRGSRMPSKVCDLEIYLSRNKEDPDPEVRNTIKIMVKNNRWGSTTGPGGLLRFDPKTFKVSEHDENEFEPTV
jgi:twinkle protein